MSTSLPVVRPGAFCKFKGAKGVTANGLAMVCEISTDSRLHWASSDPSPPLAGGGTSRGRMAVISATPGRSPAPQQPLPFVPAVTLPPPAAAAPEPLTDRDKEILAFESRQWASPGAKESAILATFKMSGIRYYQQLLRLLDHPQAVAAYPTMVNRLRRLAQRRRGR